MPDVLVSGFLLAAAPAGRSASYFELRYSDNERPFHLALRPSARAIAVNAMVGGQWGIEEIYDVPTEADLSQPILVLRKAQDILILTMGLSIRTHLPPATLREEWPQPFAHSLEFEPIAPVQVPEADWDSTAPKITSLPVPGFGHLRIPAPIEDEAVALFSAIRANGSIWLAQLAALEPGCELPPATSDAEKLFRAYWHEETATSNPPAPLPFAAPTPPVPPRTKGLDIVVSLYNQEALITECVESLLAEAPDDIRILVVDDGSTDGSVHKLEQIGTAASDKLTIIRKPNGGCASARNHGRQISDRTHIAFVDADDLTDHGFFPALWRVAQATGADFVSGSFDVYRAGPPVRRHPYAPDQKLFDALTPKWFDQDAAIQMTPLQMLGGQPAIWRSVYSRAFLDRVDLWFPESIRAFDDFQFHQRCMSLAHNAWLVPGRKYLYRQHPDQDVKQADARHFGNLAMCATLLRESLTLPPERTRAQQATMLGVLGWSLRTLPPHLAGPYLTALAQFCATMILARNEPFSEEEFALIGHADFAPALAEAIVEIPPLGAATWAAESIPGLAYPGTVALHDAVARETAGNTSQ